MKILLVEDYFATQQLLKSVLEKDHEVVVTESEKDAEEILSLNHFDVIITDNNLQSGLGKNLIVLIKQKGWPIKCILMSGQKVEKHKADIFLQKPFQLKELKNALN